MSSDTWIRITEDEEGQLVETVRVPSGRSVKLKREQMELLLRQAGYARMQP